MATHDSAPWFAWGIAVCICLALVCVSWCLSRKRNEHFKLGAGSVLGLYTLLITGLVLVFNPLRGTPYDTIFTNDGFNFDIPAMAILFFIGMLGVMLLISVVGNYEFEVVVEKAGVSSNSTSARDVL